MDNKEKITKIKQKINDELKSKELTEIIVKLIRFIILSGIFGYIGYSFCADNNYDIQKGIVFGALFPNGIVFLKELNFRNVFIYYIVYTIIYIVALDYVPTFVGIIALFVIVLTFIAIFVSVLKKDRIDEVNKIYKMNPSKSLPKTKNNTISNQYMPKKMDYEESEYNQLEDEYADEYECEICFKIISEEEYELHDGMCEECFMDVHTDKNGHFHSDKYFDL